MFRTRSSRVLSEIHMDLSIETWASNSRWIPQSPGFKVIFSPPPFLKHLCNQSLLPRCLAPKPELETPSAYRPGGYGTLQGSWRHRSKLSHTTKIWRYEGDSDSNWTAEEWWKFRSLRWIHSSGDDRTILVMKTCHYYRSKPACSHCSLLALHSRCIYLLCPTNSTGRQLSSTEFVWKFS